MYYDERVINGVLCWRGTPTGEWTPLSAEKLTARCVRYQKALCQLETYLKQDDEMARANGILEPDTDSYAYSIVAAALSGGEKEKAASHPYDPPR